MGGKYPKENRLDFGGDRITIRIQDSRIRIHIQEFLKDTFYYCDY